ncbi:hypothetical protein [Nannocystis pusilla]|uniref:hypothetical protein n=1 Tax=Nannocystis pusilla TaxID=889268 RepID=UPI003B786416
MNSHRFFFASMVMVLSSACGGDPGDSGGSTDSGGTTETTTSTGMTTTTSSVSDSETDPTTESPTSTSTTTSTTGPGTTEAPTSTSTTTGGDPFLCEVDREGCCEVELEVEADTFFGDAFDGVVPGARCWTFRRPSSSIWSAGTSASARPRSCRCSRTMAACRRRWWGRA